MATLEAFAEFVYGRAPHGGGVADVIVRTRKTVLSGEAVRVEADIELQGPAGSRTVGLLMYAPAESRGVPTFAGLNFRGNHTITPEPDVRVSAEAARIAAAHAVEVPQRGAEIERWPLATIIRRGYAVATVWYEELEVDLPGHAAAGVRGLFAQSGTSAWGAIAAWAWGLSRLRDALEAFPQVDPRRVIAFGHSRLGKAALWASAQDLRFAAVVSNESGCGGASLFRHRTEEDIELLTSVRPHWFASGFAAFGNREEELPVDQHQLLALQAPRPTHVASAIEDAGADPYGEFLSTLHASAVFEAFGHRGTLGSAVVDAGGDIPTAAAFAEPYPDLDRRVGERLSYHVRAGKHGMLGTDWRHILDFADANLDGGARA